VLYGSPVIRGRRRTAERASRARPWARTLAPALALAGAIAGVAHAAPGEPELQITVTPQELQIGASATVSGVLAGTPRPPSGAQLALQADPYPYGAFHTVARAATASDGSFSFAALRPERNTRLRVLLEGAAAVSSATLTVAVDPAVALASRSLGPGRTRLTVRIRHALLGGAQSVDAAWFLAPRGSHVYRLAALTPTRELAPGVLFARAVVDPPSARFSYRVCLNPPWEPAMGPAAAHGPCPRHDFALGAAARRGR